MKAGYLTQADDSRIKVEWEDVVKREAKKITLTYTFAEIKEEVEKKTSYLGKYRNSEGVEHLLDVIAMTSDEDDIFQSFVKTVTANVYDAFAKYTGNANGEYVCDDGVVKFSMDVPSNLNDSIAVPLDTAVFDAIVYGIIYNWLLLASPAEAEVTLSLYDSSLASVRRRANSLNQPNYSVTVPRPY